MNDEMRELLEKHCEWPAGLRARMVASLRQFVADRHRQEGHEYMTSELLESITSPPAVIRITHTTTIWSKTGL